MSWLLNLTLRSKLLVPVVIITCLAAASGIAVLNQLMAVDQHVKSLGEVNLEATRDLLQADVDLHQALVQERSLLFLNPDSADFATAVKTHAESLDNAYKNLTAFRKRIPDTAVNSHFAAYESAREQWARYTREVVAARQANTREGRTTAIEISFKDGNRAFQTLRDTLRALQANVHQRSGQSILKSHQSIVHSHYVLGITLGLCIIIAIALAIFIPKIIVIPIKNMQKYISQLTHDGGNLAHSIPIFSRDELGELGNTVNEFISSLRQLVIQVVTLGSDLHKQSKSLKGLAQKNSSLVSHETEELSQVVESISQLSQSVQQVAELALEATNRTSLARSESHTGLGVVNHTITGINQLEQKVKNTAEVISRLSGNSTSIIGVVNVIRGIADQINLLALNAAIEAARAGEQGRGFAVVADSVRELAFRTAESTQEIQGMISALQESAQQAVDAMMASQSIAGHSVTQAGDTGAALRQIDASVQRIADVNERISSSAGLQSKMADGISTNTANISRYAQDGAKLALDVANSADILEQVAAQLERTLGKFKTH